MEATRLPLHFLKISKYSPSTLDSLMDAAEKLSLKGIKEKASSKELGGRIGSFLDSQGGLVNPNELSLFLYILQGVTISEGMNIALYRTFDGLIGKSVGGTVGILEANGISQIVCYSGGKRIDFGEYQSFGDLLRDAILFMSLDGKALLKIEEGVSRGDRTITRTFIGLPLKVVRSKTSRAPFIETYSARFAIASFDEPFVDLDDITGIGASIRDLFMGTLVGVVNSSMFWGSSYL